MFRYERPQYGRLRQFKQFGVEVIGIKNYLLDVELILFGFNLLKNIGLKNIILKLNYLTVGITKIKYLKLLTDFLKKKLLCFNCKIRLQKNPLRILECKIDYNKFINAPKIYNFLTTKENKEFTDIQNLLIKLNIPFYLDHQLVRGLDYYTGIVFEIIINNKKQKLTLLGGGRYDKLINTFKSNLDYPAIGFALGLERLLLTLSDNNIILSDKCYFDVYLICLSENVYYFTISLLLLLRENNFRVNWNYSIRNIKYQFRSLSKSKLKVINVIIIGDKEFKKNVVKIKNQKTGKEEEVNIKNIIMYLNKEKK